MRLSSTPPALHSVPHALFFPPTRLQTTHCIHDLHRCWPCGFLSCQRWELHDQPRGWSSFAKHNRSAQTNSTQNVSPSLVVRRDSRSSTRLLAEGRGWLSVYQASESCMRLKSAFYTSGPTRETCLRLGCALRSWLAKRRALHSESCTRLRSAFYTPLSRLTP